eukprot:CAMPEP_0175828020 /NCGR_PEP_ID=MMETSP0107_2-20121207/12587_1 /TAXON_ID=195067 ORGANISM="Goniomonas pacifica, Strain CCMP1869" /NCGR_SAMPLE_ID=MMETSP0107_2 /ASSEMBLY_ACC=CAM_ASM_000203 /LENGTH=82 /DNA_ID=CAMNT_0017140721 /DNA_START=231 /DNA_END=476 /DNA_ORIENTATION=+
MLSTEPPDHTTIWTMFSVSSREKKDLLPPVPPHEAAKPEELCSAIESTNLPCRTSTWLMGNPSIITTCVLPASLAMSRAVFP